MNKSLSSLKQVIKNTKQKKIISSINFKKQEVTKLAGLATALIKHNLKNPMLGLSVAGAAMTKDPKEMANAAIKNFGIWGWRGINYNNVQAAKQLGPYNNFKPIKSI
jgi:hypothetical protein